jgi:2-polyprenyl-6-methoxyphenol hydroxylase-like FAD-dependent oxidoreductase
MPETFDVVIAGGGLAGSALATVLAREGRSVLVLERETKFKDRVRGENMLPWGAAIVRQLGLRDTLVAAGAHPVPFFNMYAMGTQTEHRPMPQTTPSGEACLNMYHPDLQEALLAGTAQAGAVVKRGVEVRGVSEDGGARTVSVVEDGASQTVRARLVVGADGRFSSMREWGGFTLKRDPDRLRIAGTLVHDTNVPDDGVHFNIGPGFASFIAPLGNRRARMYVVYVGAMDHKLTGANKLPQFFELSRAAGAPADWFDGVEVMGPLAEFEGADRSVPSPARRGIALIGDAAAATDPSWGCGLSKTMVDVQALATCLTDTDDWDAALERYAARHDDYYGRLHDILSWMTELVWTPGPAADERRARVFPRMQADPTGFPDASGQGPFGPSDERARRLVLGEDS